MPNSWGSMSIDDIVVSHGGGICFTFVHPGKLQ